MKNTKTKVGEKYIIEIGSEYGSSTGDKPKKLYRAKGFNSLVFDEKGLNMMQKLTPEDNESDLEAYRNAIIKSYQMSYDTKMRLFGGESVPWIIQNVPPKEMIASVNGSEIAIGAECVSPDGRFVVAAIDKAANSARGFLDDGSGDLRVRTYDLYDLERTGQTVRDPLANAGLS